MNASVRTVVLASIHWNSARASAHATLPAPIAKPKSVRYWLQTLALTGIAIGALEQRGTRALTLPSANRLTKTKVENEEI